MTETEPCPLCGIAHDIRDNERQLLAAVASIAENMLRMVATFERAIEVQTSIVADLRTGLTAIQRSARPIVGEPGRVQ